MNSSSQVDKSEWEAFIQDLSALEKKFELLLTRLDDAERRAQGSNNPQQEKPISKVSSPPQADSHSRTTGGKVTGFLNRLTAKLQPHGIPSIMRPPYRASCSRCGRELTQQGRYCSHCGADFGRIMCSCGRTLLSQDKFCDRCGRPVAVAG